MKKLLFLCLFIVLTMSLIGCDTSNEAQEIISTVAQQEETGAVEETTESPTVSDREDLDEVNPTDALGDTVAASDTSVAGDTDEVGDTSDQSRSNDVSESSEPSTSAELSEVTTEVVTEATLVSDQIILENDSVTITRGGTYTISGSLDNGQIIVDAGDADDVELILMDVNINSDVSAPIYVINANQVTITLEGDLNVLSIGGDISNHIDGIDGVIFSKSDLVFGGSGILDIHSDYAHGIVGKDDVEFVGGSYKIDVAQDGIQANDSVSVLNTTLSILADKDGIQVDNDENTKKGYVYAENSEINIETGEDGVNASNYIQIVSGQVTIDAGQDGLQSDIYLYLLDGTYDITSGGGYQGVLNIITVGEGSGNTVSQTDQLTASMKGIKSNDILVENGSFLISSYEDAFNANNDIVINGGDYTINSGDEAFTAHNSLEINGGTIDIQNGYEGLEGTYITINGGDISINVLDDGINGGETTSLVTIAGGNLSITCQGDGLDSNGDMVISGGYIVLDVSAIYVGGDGNVDVTGTLTYTGGTIVDGSGVSIDPTQQSTGGRGQAMPGGGGRR